ncbi:alpha/beta fold hydrolase [Legionella sp. km772]|uniref:alpha/beta fold hydrolase n=1 Tax=Legionella sp. km772 TaxID=2498111 RepID=UPI000F8DCC2A|nr:alpha/beta hydrolase [Legionella sp. km772]RUR08573.1 alpha/beta hydrolase [Legionella sp. km772]
MDKIELRIPGLTIAGRTWGNPQNPPILALHGWLDNANSFEPIGELLQDQYYFIAVDLPGHGFSSPLPPGVHYHFIDGLFSIVQIIEALKVQQVHLIGHSLGACMASLVASIAPDYLMSLSLIEGLGPLTRPPESCVAQLTQYLNSLNAGKRNNPKGYPDKESAALARAEKGYVSLEIAKKLCERGLREENGNYYWRHDRRLLSPSPLQMTETQVLSCLKEVRTRSFLLWADKGFSFNNELMERRVQAVKQLTLHHLQGGHHIHMEQPQAVAALLASFMKNQ